MLKKLPLEQIIPNPLNDYETTDISDMLVSIRMFGILQPPIVVGPNADDKYLLISGERRYLAAKELAENEDDDRFKEIVCVINGPADMPEDKQKLLIETANIIVRGSFDRKLHALRLANLVLNVEQDPKEAVEHLKTSLNCSKRYAMMLLNIEARGVEEVHDMVQSTTLQLKDAERIANQNPQKQKDLVDKIKSGQPVEKVISTLPGYKTSPKSETLIEPFIDAFSPDEDQNGFNECNPSDSHEDLQPAKETFTNEPKVPKQPPRSKIIDTLPSEPFKGQVYLAEELEKQIEEEDAMSLEMFGVAAGSDDLQNLSINLSSVGALPSSEDTETTSDNYSSFLKRIQNWCENIITKDTLTEEEDNTVASMIEVVEHFF